MKTTNQFDYPTAVATNYKAYREDNSMKPNSSIKNHYKNVIKQESQNERVKSKAQLQKKKQQETIQQQNRIRSDIQRKKKQLQQLEDKRLQALQNERKAAEFAKIKEQQDRIWRIEQEQKAKQYEDNANFRFKDALRRLESEKQQNSLKERQALFRRKVNQEIQKEQRDKANKYATFLKEREEQDRQRALQEQKRCDQLYRQGLAKHGLSKNIDYSKTCFHNPKMVYKYDDSKADPTAFQKGEQEDKRQKQLSAQKIQRQQENRKRSLERGERALIKLQRQKEYRNYCQETEKQQKQYNLSRIQAGKKNQFTGLKPLTLNQMQMNKKIRSEEQFEDLFIKAPEVTVIDNSLYANKYTIIENKFKSRQNSEDKWKQVQNEEKSYYVFNPTTDNKRYSFEDNNIEQIQQLQIKQVPTPIVSRGGENKRQMAETRAEDVKNNRQQLSYSQSQQDSSYH